MADCAAAGVPLSSPAPSAHRCAAAGLDSGTPAELLASMPFDGAVDRLEWARPRTGSAGDRRRRPQPVRQLLTPPLSRGQALVRLVDRLAAQKVWVDLVLGMPLAGVPLRPDRPQPELFISRRTRRRPTEI